MFIGIILLVCGGILYFFIKPPKSFIYQKNILKDEERIDGSLSHKGIRHHVPPKGLHYRKASAHDKEVKPNA